MKRPSSKRPKLEIDIGPSGAMGDQSGPSGVDDVLLESDDDTSDPFNELGKCIRYIT